MSTGISTGPNLVQSEVENPDASMRYGSVNTQVADKQVPDAYAIAETRRSSTRLPSCSLRNVDCT